MAVNINRSFMNNTGLNTHNCFTNLMNSISPDLENETDTINHSRYYDDNSYKIALGKLNCELSILNLNCQNLKTKFDKLKIFLADIDTHSQITCITLQETWFSDVTDVSFYSIPGYTLVSETCRITTHGGVAIYIHNDFSYEEKIYNNTSAVFENIAIEIWRNNKIGTKYLISSVYRPPTVLVEDLTCFIEEFTEFLNKIGQRHRRAYVCCDTNINLLLIHENNHYNTFYDNVTAQGFMPQITLPTRLSDTCDTLIDNIFTNSFDKQHKNCVLTRKISDHQMTCCILPKNTIKQMSKVYVEVETINQHTMGKLKEDLIKNDIYATLDHNILSNPNNNYEILVKSLTDAKNKYMPKKVRKFNKLKDKKEKWMTDELLTLIKRKNSMYIDWKTNSRSIDDYNNKKINFKTFDKIVDEQKEDVKHKFYHATFNNYKTNMKKTWQTINETLGRHKKETKLPTSVLHNNRHITEPTEIANAFNDYFVNIGTNLAETIDTTNENTTFINYLQHPTRELFDLKSIHERDILNILNHMDSKSSTGYDSLSNKLLKFIKLEIYKALTLVVNQMLHTGIFPDALKIAKIMPIYKKGDINELSNYRPISLLPTLSKIFERIIYDQLYTHFTENNLLSEQQYGFRSKHSTELAAIKLVDYINKEIDQKNTPVNIYIDLSKAFDTLNFDILLYKLDYYGISGDSLRLIKNYLTNRKQYVIYNTHKSSLTDIKTGVPQGSILGPLLFSIYINDLINVSAKLSYLMYADDTTIYFNLEDFPINNIEYSVSCELSKVHTWLQHNKLSLNADKTKCMTFHTRQKKINPLIFSIDGQQIENVKHFKFLGIMFDDNLSWNTHVDMVSHKLSKVVGILGRLKITYPKQALLHIYNSLFVSHLNYGLLLWGRVFEKIFKLQKKAIRIITHSEYLAHTEPLFKSLGLLKVHDLYNLKLLKFYYNLSYNLLPSYFNCYLELLHKENVYNYNLRPNSRPILRLPRTRLVFAESSVLFQLFKLINKTHTQHPQILRKVEEKSHTYSGFCFNVTQIYLQMYEN